MDREGALDGLTLPQGWAPSEQIRTALETRVESLRQIARDTGDAAVINNDGLLKRAYEEIAAAIPGVESSVVQKLEGLVYSKDSLAQELPELLALLSIGVPPNRTALKVAGLRSVINAGWIYRIARLPIPYRADKSWGVEDDITLNRLILKAIEYIDVQEEYDQWKREKKTKG
jgi:hypothetical protein